MQSGPYGFAVELGSSFPVDRRLGQEAVGRHQPSAAVPAGAEGLGLRKEAYLDFLEGEVNAQHRLLDMLRQHRRQPASARCERELGFLPGSARGRGMQSHQGQSRAQFEGTSLLPRSLSTEECRIQGGGREQDLGTAPADSAAQTGRIGERSAFRVSGDIREAHRTERGGVHSERWYRCPIASADSTEEAHDRSGRYAFKDSGDIATEGFRSAGRPRDPEARYRIPVGPADFATGSCIEGDKESRQDHLAKCHCSVEPAPPSSRAMLKHLLMQQRCRYTLGRVVRSVAPTARRRFDLIRARDAATGATGQAAPFHAIFCGADARHLAAALASPFGFAACTGAALLFALDLCAAEALHRRWRSLGDGFVVAVGTAPFGVARAARPATGLAAARLLLAELALGRCESAEEGRFDEVLREASRHVDVTQGALPMVPSLEREFRRGADSVFFPGEGLVVVLSPERALPLLLAEYAPEAQLSGE